MPGNGRNHSSSRKERALPDVRGFLTDAAEGVNQNTAEGVKQTS